MNRKEKEVEADLEKKGYPKLIEKVQTDEEEETEDSKKLPVSYDYLTGMPIRQLTYEKKQELEKEAQRLDMLIKDLKAKTIQQLWREELMDLSATWESYRKSMEEQYNSKESIKAPVKKTKAKK